MDDEKFAFVKSVMTSRGFFDADQDHRRFERERAKRADRDAVKSANRVFGRNDRHAARKPCERGAKFIFADSGFFKTCIHLFASKLNLKL